MKHATSATQYEIRKYTHEYRDQIVDLQRQHWSRDNTVNSEYLLWKYEQNPYVERPLIYMALHNGRVVGMRGVYGARWCAAESGRDMQALCSGDLVVSAEHRGRSLPRRIMRLAEEDVRDLGYRYLLNFSASPATYLHSVRMGWRDIGAFGTMSRRSRLGGATDVARAVLAKRRTLASFVRRLRARANSLPAPSSRTGERPFSALDASAAARGYAAQNPPIFVARCPRPSAMAELVERIGTDGRVRHVRNCEYFAWRFRNPLSAYRFLFWGDDRLEGYLVLEMPLRAYQRRGRVVDWEASAAKPREDLLRAAIRWGRFADLRIWSATLSAETVGLLAKYRFGDAETPPTGARYRHGLLVKNLRDPARTEEAHSDDLPLPDLSGWDLRMAYSDKC